MAVLLIVSPIYRWVEISEDHKDQKEQEAQ
jgi:hypothetical protein